MKKKMILVKNQAGEPVWSMVLPDLFTKADLKAYVTRAEEYAKHVSKSHVFIVVEQPERNPLTFPASAIL